MKRWMSVLVLCVTAVLLCGGLQPHCWGAPLITFTDTNTDTFYNSTLNHDNSFIYFSWTQTVATQDTTIGAIVFTPYSPLGPGTAWLTNKVGPGTTSDNVIASAQFTAQGEYSVQEIMDLTTAPTCTMFTGLTLGPGTYYVVLQAPSSSHPYPLAVMGDWSGVLVTTSPGFTVNPWECSTLVTGDNNAAFPPSSTFDTANNDSGIYSFYSVEGTVVPLPSTVWLLGGGLLGLAGWKRFRKG